MIFSGALNGELFKKYLEEFLVPTLNPGDVLIMDNRLLSKLNLQAPYYKLRQLS